jgi:hypothetical protein
MTHFDLSPFPGGEVISEYARRFRRDDVGSLEIGPALDLFPEEPGPRGFQAGTVWQRPWPHALRSGVYLIYDQDFKLIYIGKAWNFGPRLAQHFGSNPDSCRLLGKWPVRPRYVINVAVPDDMAFEAAALEAYLIHVLKPSDNYCGKHTWD